VSCSPRRLATRVGALAIAACACTTGTEPPPIYPEGDDGARRLGTVALYRQITLPDNFILRPDEFGSVAVDAARGLIYVGSRDGNLLALAQDTGEVVWELPLGGPVSGTPVLARTDDGEHLLVGTDNGALFSLDPETLKERWSYQTDGRIRNPALVVEGVVYLVNSRDQVFALDARKGAWRWQYEQELQTDFTVLGHAGLGFVPSVDPTAGDPGTLFACFDNGKVVALSASSGEALWIASVASTDDPNFVDCDSTPVPDLQRQRVYVAGQSTGVFGLALEDGARQWHFPVEGVGSIAEGPGGALVVASSLEGVFALDRDGHSLWRTQLDPGSLSWPVLAGDAMVVTHSDLGLVALEPSTGEVLGRMFTGSGMSSTPIFDPGSRRLYAISNRGVLVGIQLDAQ
jgi:outer membrane protein assembly factor BamB